MCVYIKHTGGDGIRKMDDEVISFDICDAMRMLCGLTWVWQYMNWSADEHEARRIRRLSREARRIQSAEIESGDMIQPAEIESGDMIQSVYIEPGDMIRSIYIEPDDVIEPAGIL